MLIFQNFKISKFYHRIESDFCNSYALQIIKWIMFLLISLSLFMLKGNLYLQLLSELDSFFAKVLK